MNVSSVMPVASKVYFSFSYILRAEKQSRDEIVASLICLLQHLQ